MTSTKFLRPLMLGALIAATGTTAYAASHTDRFGNAVPVSGKQRTIELQPGTRYLNIEQGQTLKFIVQGKAFAWNFDTFGTPVFNLAEIAPKDVDVGNVKVYISPDRTYAGGSK